MAGRPQKRSVTRRRPTRPAPVLDGGPAVVSAPVGAPNHSALSPEARARRRAAASPIYLSHSYLAALAAEISEADTDDPDTLRRRVISEMKKRRSQVGQALTVADALSAALVGRAADPGARDGVLAIRELADRTEGPVVQRTADVSVRYVISTTPGEASGTILPALSADEWERQARGDWDQRRLDEALPVLPPGSRS